MFRKKNPGKVAIFLFPTVDLMEVNGIEEKGSSFCLSFPKNLTEECYADMAVRMIQVELGNLSKAVALCREGEGNEAGKRCYEDVIDFIKSATAPDSQEFKDACSRLPENLRNKCLEQKI